MIIAITTIIVVVDEEEVEDVAKTMATIVTTMILL